MVDGSTFRDLVDVVRTTAKLDAHRAMTADSHLVQDLGIDSLDLVGVLLAVQDKFDVVIAEEDIPGLETLGQLAMYVEQRRPSAAA